MENTFDIPHQNKLFNPGLNGAFLFSPAYRASSTLLGNQSAVGDQVDQITNFDGTRTSDAVHAGANVRLASVPGLDIPLWHFDGSGGFDFIATGTEFRATNLPDAMTWYVGMIPMAEGAGQKYLTGFNQDTHNNRNFGIGYNQQSLLSGEGSRMNTYRGTSAAALRQYPISAYDQCRVGGLAQMEFHHTQSGPFSEMRMGTSEPLVIDNFAGSWTTANLFNRFSIGNGNAVTQAIISGRAANDAAIAYIAIYDGLTDGERFEIRKFLQDQTNAVRVLLAGDSIMDSIQGRRALERSAQKFFPIQTALVANAGDTIAGQQVAIDTAITTEGNRPTDIAVQVGINDFVNSTSLDDADPAVVEAEIVSIYESNQTLLETTIDSGANLHWLTNLFWDSSTSWSPQRQTAHEKFLHRTRAFISAQPSSREIDLRGLFGNWSSTTSFDEYWGKDALHPETWGYTSIQFPAIAKSIVSDNPTKFDWVNPVIRADWLERFGGNLNSLHSRATEARLTKLDRNLAAVGDQMTIDLTGIEITNSVFLQTVFESLEVVRYDRHNGTEAPQLTWPTSKSYDNRPIKLLIFRNSETILAEGDGFADGNTATIDDIEILIDADKFTGNPLVAKLNYAVVAGTGETIRFGPCNVQFRPDIDDPVDPV